MIAFIDDHRQEYGVEPICKVLPIAPSTYHAHVAQRTDPAKLSTRAKQDSALKEQIRRIFEENFRVYGVRKVWRQMQREGIDVARCTIARLMKAMGIAGVIRGKPHRTTFSDKAAPCPLDRVNRDFKAPAPNGDLVFFSAIDEGVVKGLPKSAQAQVDLAKGHFFEQGAMAPAILSKVAPFVASPEKFRKGLEFTKTFYHRTGITLACKPGGFLSKPMQDAINAVYSGDDTPFNHCFIGDGKSFYAIKPNDATSLIAETRKVEGWGKGRTFYLPQQAKLFTDGAIYSQLMQMKDGYTDGHHGAWIVDPAAFDFMFQTYWDAGYQIHIHNNGDAGFDVALERRRASEGDGCAAVSSAHAHA